MTTALQRRITNLERIAAINASRAPVKIVLVSVAPEMDDNGRIRGPGRIVSRIELVDLKPTGAKPCET
jgi:hypothetical protein